MKQCPVCKTTYTDETLKYCLADGATLFSVPDPNKTEEMPYGKSPVQVNIPSESAPTVFPPAISNQPARSNASLIIIALLIGLLFLVIAGFAGYVLLRGQNEIAGNSDTPSANALPNANDEDEKLREELANLKKQVEEQKNPKKESPSPQTLPTREPTAKNTARVNSPNDGFLALRTSPDAEYGERIAKIPHGATVSVISCQNSVLKVAGRRGTWCQISYGGMQGWAFDAWLSY